MFTRDQLKPYIEKGLISVQVHPRSDDVCIYNYTQKCQYDGAWDDVTMRCRGLIIDWRGEPKQLSNPLPKFFNFEEHIQRGLPLPADIPNIFEKLDGWLGILYWLDGEPWVATRGSFTSPGAEWATQWVRQYINVEDDGWTHTFEIICPITKIVCNYQFEGLVWLTARNIKFPHLDVCAMPNTNFSYFTLKATPPNYGGREGDIIRRAARVPDANYDALKAQEEHNKEGFVLVYPDGMRLKIKFDEYKRLHKIITGVSAIGIWEMLRDGKDITFDNVPDEFFKWVENVAKELQSQYNEIFARAGNAHAKVKNLHSRKDQALWLNENAKDVAGIVFLLLDGKSEQAIQSVYKIIRPHGNMVFKKDD